MSSPFAERSSAPELIDDPALPARDYAAAMRDLERVNRILHAHRPTLAFLDRAARGMTAVRVLDVGSGHGDLLRAIAGWAARKGIAAELTGIDLSAAATAAAVAATPQNSSIRFLTADVFEYRPDPRPDFILSSLFAHHLADTEAVRFLQWMEDHAQRGWHLNDLHRHPLALAGFVALSRVARLHPIVRHDGAISVRRGFTRRDWSGLLHQAGVEEAKVRWWLPFRFGIDRIR